MKILFALFGCYCDNETMKKPMYKAITVYSLDRDDVIFEEISSAKPLEEDLMIP